MLRMIGNTSRADVVRIDSKISVVQDIERYSPVQLFTPKNTIGYSVTMFNADIPDAVSIRYIDEDAGYAQNELSVYHTPDGNRIKEPDSIQKLDLWGVTNSIQARRIGMYNYACLKNRPFVHTIEADIEYLMCNKGDWIQYSGDLALTGSVHGRIIEPLFANGRCVGIRADESVEMSPDKQYAVRLRKSDGTVLLKDAAAIRKPDEIYFVEPFGTSDAPCAGDVYAFGMRGMEVLDLVITDIQPGQNLSATLTCVEYSPAIFGVDDPNFVLPEFENKITPVSGAIDSGIVNPNRYRLFITYHDSDYEPPWPAGDGQNGGWHYAQTLRSVWQSSKNAEAVDQGEWGPPVRIKNTRDNTDVVPVYLTLSPQRTVLECDGDGNVIAGLLPFAVQSALYMWNVRIATHTNIRYYPGSTPDLFDPMLGDFYPDGAQDIEFSLPDAPDWITVDDTGLITVAADAAFEDENSITVQARYKGETYTAVLFIGKDTRRSPARYLGTIDTLPETASVFIIKGPVQGQVKARQGDYVLAVADGYAWQKGYVYQWSGTAWEKRAPDQYTDLYIRCFKDGLDVPELTQDMGWFGALIARVIVAQQDFIEELQTQIITLKNNGLIKSENYIEGTSGFMLPANGKAVFNDEVFIYNLKVVKFEIIPPSGTGTLIENLVGYKSKSISLSIGWYEVELSGGGGGRGGSNNKGIGGSGGKAGYIKHRFYNHYSNATAVLMSGATGGNGDNGGGTSGSGGGGSVFQIDLLSVILIAGGGGGGGAYMSAMGSGAGGGGGGNGNGGNGGFGNGSSGSTSHGGNGGGGGNGSSSGGYGSSYMAGSTAGGTGGGGIGGNGGNSGHELENSGFDGGTSINGFVIKNAGNGSNAGVNGFIRLYKLS
jgi:hypothetical protein